MARADRDLTLTSVAALAATSAAAALGAMQVLEDVAVSLIVGGLLFVSFVSFCRSPQTVVARRTR